jgi:hypothetical protein
MTEGSRNLNRIKWPDHALRATMLAAHVFLQCPLLGQSREVQDVADARVPLVCRGRYCC